MVPGAYRAKVLIQRYFDEDAEFASSVSLAAHLIGLLRSFACTPADSADCAADSPVRFTVKEDARHALCGKMVGAVYTVGNQLMLCTKCSSYRSVGFVDSSLCVCFGAYVVCSCGRRQGALF